MALRATVYKAEVQVADLDRQHYADYSLTLARHPSETDERLMVRLLAFVLHADERLQFGKGLSTEDEPTLSLLDDGGVLRLIVEVGLPDETRLRKACNRADRVCLLAYGGRAAEVWWQQNETALRRHDNLDILVLTPEDVSALGARAERNMRVSCTVQDGGIYVDSILVTPQPLLTRP